MKHFLTRKIAISLLALFAILLGTSPGKACDRSSARLDSVVFGAGFVDVHITTFIGAGITGFTKGADGPTRTFAYGVYGDAGLTNFSFTPSVTSDSTKATYNGTLVPGAFGTNFAIGYIFSGVDFACVSTTALCGHRHTDTIQVVIRTNSVPDSVRVFGIEGQGNPLAGCYPDADMLLEFNTLPVVWAGFEAWEQPFGVDLKWTTASESNNDHFLVRRSGDGAEYETIGTVEAAGNSTKANSYNFVDPNPRSGTNFYKIVQVDIDGHQSASEVRQVVYDMPSGMHWTQFGPNPVRDRLSLGYYLENGEDLLVSLVDLQGRTLLSRNVRAQAGINQLNLDLNSLADGFYSLQLKGSRGMLEQRVIKM